jgi:hypothetical protein
LGLTIQQESNAEITRREQTAFNIIEEGNDQRKAIERSG